MRHIYSGLRTERGSSLVEFAMCAPLLLLIAGSTLDVSRYIRYLQVTSHVSQEASNLSYVQCSDITVYKTPSRNQQTLEVNESATLTAIDNCIQKITKDAQKILDDTLPKSVISAAVIRYDLDLKDHKLSDDPCTNSSPVFREANCKGSDCQKERETHWKWHEDEEEEEGSRSPSKGSENVGGGGGGGSKLFEPSMKVDGGQFKIVNPKTGETRLIVEKAEKCNGKSLVAVEVAYSFTPIVKFLPNWMTGEVDGIHRETTIL